MSFPSNPTNGQTAIVNNIGYQYNSTLSAWFRILSGITATNTLFISGTQTSTSTTTGALVVAGGVGIGGNAYISSFLTVSGNGNATTSTGALVNFIGNLGGNYLAPQNNGVVLQMTGQASNPARVYIDGQGSGNYSAVIGRHYNGTTAAPAGLNANDTIFRLGGTPYNTSGWPSLSTVRWDMIADETQTAFNQGSRIELWITPRGTSVTNIAKQLSLGSTGSIFYNTLTVASSAISASTGTGALIVQGGAGIGGSVFVGGNLTVGGTINATISGSSSSATNILNGTTGSILYQTAPGVTGFIGIGSTGSVLSSNGTTATYVNTLTLSGTISHAGLVPTQGLNIDQIFSTSTNITLTKNWQNTGITGTMLTTGTYIVQALANDSSVGGGEINTYYSGIMSWYSGATSEGSYDEILLHRAGAASGSGTVYLQVLRAVGGVLSLQIAGNTNNSTTSIYYLNFRRML